MKSYTFELLFFGGTAHVVCFNRKFCVGVPLNIQSIYLSVSSHPHPTSLSSNSHPSPPPYLSSHQLASSHTFHCLLFHPISPLLSHPTLFTLIPHPSPSSFSPISPLHPSLHPYIFCYIL